MNQITEKITNCLDCHAHVILNDPDPNDSSCRDDQAVLCTLTQGNPNHEPESQYHSERQSMHRCVTVSCRPSSLRKESAVPDWCPKLEHSHNPLQAIEERIVESIKEIGTIHLHRK